MVIPLTSGRHWKDKGISVPAPPFDLAYPALPFTVRAWAAWRAVAEPAESGSAGNAGESGPAPVLLRRRVSPLGQHALRLAWRMACSGEARIVAVSRHGEFTRSLGIMGAVVAGEPASPGDFTLSVHHALAGLLAIARGNRAGHTAVAAGPESFCAGFLEAAACLADAPSQPVLLMQYDEPLPAPFDRCAPAWPAMALVVLLAGGSPMGSSGGEAMTMSVRPAAAPAPAPVDPAAQFRDFLADPAAASLTVSGERMQWTWRRSGAMPAHGHAAAA